ncbi:MAG: hypothetical protein QOE86_2978 [Solirubrobacteraceae bacterium]|nr:hypothetical protein [Solirubrobacteraceae bacterium]
MGGVLDHRVYRAAFLPALVALFVVAFSLADPAMPRTTRLAPDAFQADRAFGPENPPASGTLRGLAQAFPNRRPGSPGDTGMADRVAQIFESTGFAGHGQGATIRRVRFNADTIDGERRLEDVIATRQGLSSRSIVVIAHRDAPAGPAVADLSGTATLLELSRLFAARELRKTVVLASVSGGSGGFAGAARIRKEVPGPVDAVIVLGNLASVKERRPFVLPWANGGDPAPYSLQRTAASALRTELTGNTGRDRAIAQWLRRAFPLTTTEQGEVGATGLPAVLISATGERRPAADAAVSQHRLETFGRGVLRTLTAALDAGGIEADPASRRDVKAFPASDGIIVMKRLLPSWAIRLLVATLLLPVLLAAFDGFFRARRRGLPVGRWWLWTMSFGVAPLIAWAWARLLGATGAVTVLPAPAAQGVLPLQAAGVVAMVSVVLVLTGAALGLRPRLVQAIGARGDAGAGGAAAAMGLALAVLVGLVWLGNPYAAAVLLPAAHVWLLACEPGSRARGKIGAVAVLAGLLLPALVVAYYAHAWGLGPVEGLWSVFGIVAGGTLGLLQGLVLAGFVAALCATVVILRARGRAAASAPPERVTTRGPRSYAGPGSLGGTESALRR